jgi:hypothetical protein
MAPVLFEQQQDLFRHVLCRHETEQFIHCIAFFSPNA